MIYFLLLLLFSQQILCSQRFNPVGKGRKQTEISNPSERVVEDSWSHVSKIDFKAYCPKACLALKNLINLHAKNQLGLDERSTKFDFNHYKIENWPEFVPLIPSLWDEKAYNDIKEALPTLVFKPKEPVITRRSSNEKVLVRNRIINRSKLASKLLNLFNEQTRKNSPFIQWRYYHLIDWPVGVSLHVNHLSAIEVLVVSRHLDRIKFVKVLQGETRTVTFTDGTVCNASDLACRRSNYKKGLKSKKRKFSESDENSLSESEESSLSDSEEAALSEPVKELETPKSEDGTVKFASKVNGPGKKSPTTQYISAITRNEKIFDSDIGLLKSNLFDLDGFKENSDTIPFISEASILEDESDYIEALKQYDPNEDYFYGQNLSNFR